MRLFLLFLSTLPFYVSGQTWHHTQKVTDNFRNSQIFFGNAVDIQGDYAVVGCYQDSYDENNSNPMGQAGTVSIFLRDANGNWSFQQKLVAANRHSGAYFGWSVAIDSHRIAVGAMQHGTGSSLGLGSVYTYVLQSGIWQLEQQIFPEDVYQNAKFGCAVDIMDDYMVVGAYGHATDSANLNPIFEAGAGYFFERINGSWVQMKKVSSQIRLNTARFGYRVAIHGENALISAPKDAYDEFGLNPIPDAGAVFHYRRNSNDSLWYEQQKMLGNPRGGEFGSSVSMIDSFMLVGQPHMAVDTFFGAGFSNLYQLSTSGSFGLVQKINAPFPGYYDNFGWSCGFSNNFAIVGAPNEDEDPFEQNTLASTGSAYVFKLNLMGDTLDYHQKINAPNHDRNQGDRFGWSVGVSEDCALGGAINDDTDENDANYVSNDGAVYLFDTICPVDFDTIVAAICMGDTYSLGNLQLFQSGVYSYVFNNVLGCDSTVILTLTVNNHSVSEQTTTACTSYQWPITGASYSQSGNYIGVIPNGNGCDSSITLHLTILPTSASTQTIDACFSYLWSANGQLYLQSGTYTETFAASNGCDSIANLDLNIREVDTSVSNGFVVLTANALNADFQWLKCDSNGYSVIPGANLSTFHTSNEEPGYFAVEVTQNGCTDTSSCHYIIGPGGINESIRDRVLIFPNPAKESVSVRLLEDGETSVQIYDLLGKVVLSTSIQAGTTTIPIDFLASGLYQIILMNEVGGYTEKIVVE